MIYRGHAEFTSSRRVNHLIEVGAQGDAEDSYVLGNMYDPYDWGIPTDDTSDF